MANMSNCKKRSEMLQHQNDETLRRVSKNWNAREWESYLQTLEIGLSESLASQAVVASKAISNNIFELSSTNSSEEISKIVSDLLSQLSERQALVLTKIFWDGKSERKIAREMKISRQAVYDLKKRALRNLRKDAKGVLANSPIVEAEVLLIVDRIEASDQTPAA